MTFQKWAKMAIGMSMANETFFNFNFMILLNIVQCFCWTKNLVVSTVSSAELAQTLEVIKKM